MSSPNFSPFPFASLRRLTRREAAFESACARWIAARPLGAHVAKLVGGPARAAIVGHGGGGDPHAAFAEVRVAGASIVLAAPARPVRALAQRLLGGPDELAAARPLGAVEQAIWALGVAAAIEDAGVTAEVWPLAGPPPAGARAVELAIAWPGGSLSITAYVPPALELRAPPPRAWPDRALALPIVVGRCALLRAELAALAVRDVVTLDGGGPELVIGAGSFGLRAAPGALAAEVATGYVRRDVGLPDDVHVELTVQLGTAQLSLRRIAELALGEIIPLGRPLAGPYEVRAAGQLLGHGELVDVDGELGVRIVSFSSRSGEE